MPADSANPGDESSSDRDVRSQIVDAAFSVLQEVGPTRLRIQEVARRAGVSPTLLYYYFDGKHALIAAAYARDYALILERDLELTRAVFAASSTPSELFNSTLKSYGLTFGDRDIRRRRLDALSAAQHDPVVAAAITPLQKAYTDELRTQVTAIRDEGWLPQTIDIEAFLMVMMALPFGLVFSDLDETFEVDVLSALALLVPRPPSKG
jgi:AcrR family transcriptional regulator